VPVSFASDVFNDGKFNFTWKEKDSKLNVYQATLTRKDNDFINFPVVFIYNIKVKEANDYHPRILSRMVFLNKGEQTKTVTEPLGSLIFCCVKKEGYGVKFPQYEDLDGDFPDAVFNLDLAAYDPWFKPEDNKIYSNFSIRSGKSINCSVTLKQAITLYFVDRAEEKWASFTLSPGETQITTEIYKFKDLKGFSIPHTDEYYLQFSK
jgi:hypothetical protein